MRPPVRSPLGPAAWLLLLGVCLIAASRGWAQTAATGTAPAPLAPQSWDPAYEPADLTVPEGYRVELAAAPPLVHHPTMIDIDSRGRLLVAESSGLSLRAEELLEQLPGRILMLRDRDDDGRFDTSHVFADQLTLPQGVLCYRDAVYVCSPPSLIRFRDTDDDGRADERTVLVDGFGFTGNAASVHGPFLAPSGRLFICQGRKPHELRDAAGTVVDVGTAARIWSCRLDGTDLRAYAGGGMDNPVEVDFTDDGQVLGTVNLLHASPRDDALIHWIADGVYPRADQIPAISEFRSTGPLLNAGVHFGHIAVSGVTRYRGDAMGDAFAGRWLVTEFNRGQLLGVTLRPQGASFGGDYQPLLTSNTENFHPTDILQDDRGDLLMVDTGGWFRQGCPSSRYARPELKGALYRIRPSGPLRPWPQPSNRSGTADEIALRIQQLTDTRVAVVQQAMDRLAQLGPPAAAALRSGWSALDEAARLQAVWAIGRSRSPQAASHLIQIAQAADGSPTVRTAALDALGAHPDPAAWPIATAAVADPHPQVARQAAALMARLIQCGPAVSDQAYVQQAARAVWHRLPTVAGDAALEHQMINVLIRANAVDIAAAGLQPGQPPIRGRAALLVLSTEDRTLKIEDLLRLAQSADAATRAVALDAITHRNDAATTIVNWVAQQLAATAGRAPVATTAVDTGSGDTVPVDTTAVDTVPGDGVPGPLTPDELQRVLTSQIGTPAAVPVVAETLRSAAPGVQQLVLDAIAAGPAQRMPAAWQPVLRQLITDGPQPLRLAAIAALQPLHFGETADAKEKGPKAGFDPLLRSIGRRHDAPLVLRVAAWRAIAGGGRELPEEGFQLLVNQLNPADLSPQRRDAASILGQVSLSSSQLQQLAAAYLPQLHPLDLPVVLEAFAGSGSTEVGQSLLRSLAGPQEQGLGNLSLEQFDRVLRKYPEVIQRDAEPLRARLRAAETERIARLGQLRSALPPGDAQRGAAIFASDQAACIRCHRIDAAGSQVGPDLSQIGRIRSTDDLLESVVLPSATIARDFETYSVLTDDGRLLAGLVQRLADGSVQITGADARPHTIPGQQIEQITPSATSVMPAGLDTQLTLQQLSDLIAYLRSRSGP